MFAKKMLVALLIGAFTFVTFAQDSKRVYLGVRAGAGLGLSTLLGEWEKEITEDGGKITRGGASFDVAPFVSLQLADVFALQTELLFTKFGVGYEFNESDSYYDDYYDETISYSYEEVAKYSRSAMVIPVLAKLTFRPENLSISAFVGPHFAINIGDWKVVENGSWSDSDGENEKWDTTYTQTEAKFKEDMGFTELKYPPVGLTAGVSFGFAAGPGNLFFDIRFLTDLGAVKGEYLSRYDDDDNELPVPVKKEEDFFRRAKLSFTVGYEFGAGSR
ncbi:MAG: PorT family protein [Chitinivibrionia bacterium]|nr:PorT family protein [Chitinivibrionia bacterium]